MIRLDDPDAAEQAARLYCGDGSPADTAIEATRRVLDAIEVPRLPTRSEVVKRFVRALVKDGKLGTSDFLGTPEGHFPSDNGYAALVCARSAVDAGWAVEDPEPEVDPAQVDALTDLLKANAHRRNGGPDYATTAKRLLASGRVSVKVDG